jgi:hypothetical protein
MKTKMNTKLKLYKSHNGYVGKIDIPKNPLQAPKTAVEFIVILDRSGSMGTNVKRLVNKILPNVFYNLGYTQTDKVTLIMFSDVCNVYNQGIKSLEIALVSCSGCTYMADAVSTLKRYIMQNTAKQIRLLTLSDGELNDIENTLKIASESAPALKQYTINSQAVRFFTSTQQPDTRGIASVLQFNSVAESKLLDLNSMLLDKTIIDSITKLFQNDGLGNVVQMKSLLPIIMKTPWDIASNTANLFEGENTVWFNDVPKDLSIDGVLLEMEICDPLTHDNFDIILKTKALYYINQLKILKVINTTETNKEITQIMQYFTELEKSLHLSNTDLIKILDDKSLRGRLEYFKKLSIRRTKSFTVQMSQIANDDKVGKLNSAQQAEYLRTVDLSKNAKGLARRALTHDIDFNAVIRTEVKNMHANLHELKDVDDSEHTVSFYSQETTLGGIRAVCQLVTSGLIDDLDVNDILKMINIVGIACSGQIGDYPDAMTWRVDNMFIGSCTSMSDILMAYCTSNGKALQSIAEHKDITNVIPFYDDERIHKFLRKYAPSMLEYTASIGMRRIIADIPMTYAYTVCAGLWQLVEDIDKYKSDINITSFVKLVNTYNIACGTYFKHILEYIKDQDETLSYYVANNGITNMINPLIKLHEVGNTKHMSKILRALYNYEVYQAVKKIFKKKDNADILAGQMLDQLIGIDLDKYKTIPQPSFTTENNPVFYDNYHINTEILDATLKSFWYVNYVTLLPNMISCITESKDMKSIVENIKKIPKMDEKSICKALDIDCDLKTFQFYNIVQCIIFNNKLKRVDSDNFKMKIIDLVDTKNAEKMVKDYVRKQYIDKYQSDMLTKINTEKRIMCDQIIEEIINADTIEKTLELFSNGISRKCITLDKITEPKYVILKINNTSSLGFVELQKVLFDASIPVLLRADKLKIFLLGKDNNNNVIWNNGNLVPCNLKDHESLFIKIGAHDVWKTIREEYIKNNKHIYREGENRHGHGNDKPSYWALGYMMIEDMIRNITKDEWLEYKQIHYDCCGVSQFK